ncbi:MAG: hypothetical protein GX444_13390 [Myxococcales bacterium]|nr:hypothetical protein [Myxococcales bacterium]
MRRLLGLTLVACAMLATEIVLTRVYSVVMWYHFAFLAISVSLFGMGLGALLAHWFGSRLAGREEAALSFAGAASGAAGGLLIALLLTMKLGDFEFTSASLLKLALVYTVSALPFVAGGLFISLLLQLEAKRAGVVYFFDLIGAGLGCLLTVPLLKLFGGPAAVLVAGALAALGGVTAGGADKKSRWTVGLAVAGGLLAVAIFHLTTGSTLLEPRYVKGNREPARLTVDWNSFSRVIAFARPDIGDIMIEIDGIAHTPITPFDGDTAKTQDAAAYLQRLPYIIRPGSTTLIFGSGGGEHVLTALDAGAKRVVALEYNPLVVDLVRNRFANVSGGLYNRPDVDVVIDEGRSYIRRTNEKFDVIQFTLIDTWAATAAGAFALSENNVFTVEAMHEYFDHLAPGGMISIKRWNDTQEIVLRLMALAKTVLLQQGVKYPERHFFIARDEAFANLMIKKDEFTLQEMGDLVEHCAKLNLPIVYSPYHSGDDPRFKELAERGDFAAWFAEQKQDLSPTTDNRPFLFYTLRLRNLPEVFKEAYSAKIHNLGPLVLYALGALVLGLVALFILLPAWLTRESKAKPPFRFALYFAALGLAYLLVEVAIMQKFILYLGHPTYALTVVLFTILLASGLGAGLSERIYPDRTVPRLRVIVGALALYVAVLLIVSPRLFHETLALALPLRIGLTVLFLLPLGLLMGMPFPLGIRLVGYDYPRGVTWMFAVNSAASVLGSVAAMLLAVNFGFSSAIILGLALYLVAGFLL